MGNQLKYIFTSDYDFHRNDILNFWQRIYGFNNVEHFDSLYKNNPLGPPFLALCYDGNKLVGTENYILQDVACLGAIYRGAMGVDTLVDPDYRLFHGVFGKLCQLTIEKLEPLVDLLFTNANDNSKIYYLKYFNWKASEKIKIYKKFIYSNEYNLRKLLNYVNPGKYYKDLHLSLIDTSSKNILNVIIDKYINISKDIFFYKTYDFINWKFINNKKYNIKGYVIFYKGNECGYCITYNSDVEKRILDIVIASEDKNIFYKTIMTLSRMAKDETLEKIVIHASDNAWYKEILNKCIFIKSMEFDYLTHIYNKNLLNKKWNIQCGDFDFF